MSESLPNLGETPFSIEAELFSVNGDQMELHGVSDSGSALSIMVSGIRESRLNAPLPKQLSVSMLSDHPLLWDYGPRSSIFGNAALPDPQRFFYEFYQAVTAELQLSRDPAEYLNWEQSLKDWLGFVYSRSFCLLSAPNQVVEAAKPLLDVQAAEYIALPDPPEEGTADVPPVRLLLLGESWVICAAASVASR